MATITRLKGVEQNKEFDRVLVRQLNFRTGSNNPIPANQVLFADGSGGTYWADPSGNYSCRAFNIFRTGTNGVYYSTTATAPSNTLKLESGYGIGMFKANLPEPDSFYIYATGPSRIQTQAGYIEFSTLSTTSIGRELNYVGLGNTIVTASSNTVFFESGGGFAKFSTINADLISTTALQFNTGNGTELTLSTLNVSSYSPTVFNVSSLNASTMFAQYNTTSSLSFSSAVGDKLTLSCLIVSSIYSINTSISSLSYSSGISLYTQSESISTNNISTNNLIGNYINAQSISTHNISTNNLFGNFIQTSTLSTVNVFGANIQGTSISTNNLSTNNLIGNYIQGTSISTNNISTNNLIGNYIQGESISTNNISTNNLIGNYIQGSTISSINFNTSNASINNLSSVFGAFTSSIMDSLSVSSLTVSSINFSTLSFVGSTLQLSTLNGFSSPIITMHWENGYVGINLGESTPNTALDVNGTIYCQNVLTYSDYRLKDNFSYANFDIDMLENLRAQKFTWKRDNSNDFGFIAQQVEAILPECVETDGNGYKLVSYQKLVPVAFDLIHNLACKVSTLESLVNLKNN
jgi:hypothetical protein